jgi:hypothetical protein
LNSRSRIGSRGAIGGTIRNHILARWENISSTGNPLRYFGVTDTGRRDMRENRIFRMDPIGGGGIPDMRRF